MRIEVKHLAAPLLIGLASVWPGGVSAQVASYYSPSYYVSPQDVTRERMESKREDRARKREQQRQEAERRREQRRARAEAQRRR